MIQIAVVVIFLILLLYVFLNVRYANRTFILCYHKVDYYKSGYRGIVVEPEKFFKQMRYLHKKGYGTIPLGDLAALIRQKKRIPQKTFAITFDDGYENFLLFALPVLKKYGFRPTVFLSAGFIGKVFKYPHQPEEKHLNAEQIKDMLPDADFGAHTVNHPDLTGIPGDRAREEISESRKIVESITGKAAPTFCYPYGRFNEKVKSFVKENAFACACTTQHGLIDTGGDLYELPRFEFKEWGHMSTHDFFRNFDFYVKTFFGI